MLSIESYQKPMYDEKCGVATRNEKTVANYKATSLGVDMPDCTYVEVDTRIILHVLNCIHCGIQNITVRSIEAGTRIILHVLNCIHSGGTK